MFLKFCVFLLAVTCATAQAPPGLVITLGDALIQGVVNDFLGIVKDALNGLNLGGLSGNTTGMPRVQYYLSDITVSKLNIGTASFASQAPNQLLLGINGISMDITMGAYATKGTGMPSNGTFTVTSVNGNIAITITESVTMKGFPKFIGASDTTFDATFKFNGKDPQNIMQGVAMFLKASATKMLPMRVDKSVNGLLADINGFIASVPSPIILDKKFAIDWSLVGLVSSPGFNSIKSKAVVGWVGPGGPNFTLPFANTDKLPNKIPGTMDDIQLMISAFTLNSALYQVNKAGIIKLVITNKMIPKSIPFHLNTTIFKGVFPELYKAYPNKGFTITVSTYEAVTINDMNNATLTANAPLSLQINVINATGPNTMAIAFTMGLPVKASLMLKTHIEMVNGTKKWNVSGEITKIGSLHAKVLSSNIGKVEMSAFNGILAAFAPGLKGEANKLLKKGVALPYNIADLVDITDVKFVTSATDGYFGLAVNLAAASSYRQMLMGKLGYLAHVVSAEPGPVIIN